MSEEWWCPWCGVTVAPENVTYQERHDIRAGGCGNAVYDDVPVLVEELRAQIEAQRELMLEQAEWLEKACFGWPPEYWDTSAEALRRVNKLRKAVGGK